MRRIGLVSVCMLILGSTVAASDVSTKLVSVRNAVGQIPVSPAQRATLTRLVDVAETHWNDPLSSNLAITRIVEALLVQLVDFVLGADHLSGPVPQQDGDPFNNLLYAVDDLAASLFFESGPSLHTLPDLPQPPPGTCTVRILNRSLGRVANDPAGSLSVLFGDLVQLEAQASEPGGVYEWTLSPDYEDQNVFSRDNRFSTRAGERGTYAISVRFQSGARVCRDWIHVRVQGEFPDVD